MVINKTIPIRKGSAQAWAEVNPVLNIDEPGWEKDTNKLKIGNGINSWNDLPYFNGTYKISSDKKSVVLINDAPYLVEEVASTIKTIIPKDVLTLKEGATVITAPAATLKKQRKRKKKN